LNEDEGVLARGGSVLGSESPSAEMPLGGVRRGAGCNDGLVEAGNAGGRDDSEVFEFAKGDAVVLEANPLDGVLLNMSKALAVFPELVDAMGPGPETSGMVWPSRARSNSGFRGVLVPFIAM